MNPDTWTVLDRKFAEDERVGAASITKALEVPSTAEILIAGQELGVPFPPDYKQFLSQYGGAMVGAYPILGLRPVAVMGDDFWSVVDVTRHFRSQRVPGCDTWVIISYDHAGNPIGFDSEGVIWIHDHDFGGITRLADSFEDYIRTWCLKLPKEA